MDEYLFERARALFQQGVADYQARRYEAAAQAFQGSLALMPGRVSVLANLGAAQLKLGQAAAALQTLDAALARQPDHAEALCHRGAAHSQLGQQEQALADFARAEALGIASAALHWERYQLLNRLDRLDEALRALQRLPVDEDAELALLLGHLLARLQRPGEALRAYDRALALDAGLAEAWSSRGHVLRHLGLQGEAAASYERALASGAEAAATDFFLSGVGVGPVPGVAPPAYVRELFDDYAERFETDLVGMLGYRGHLAVAAPLAALRPQPAAAALDLGCGTGLAGPLLRPLARRLVGVDLSPRMLAVAQRKQCYDELVAAEVLAYLQGCTAASFDLILCCDVFIYMGDLAPVFAALARVLSADGVFGFSVELDSAGAEAGYELQASLRYCHAEPYLRRLAAVHGLGVLRVEQGPLRHDSGQPLAGLFMHLGRAGGQTGAQATMAA
jgi:predicted TPR repeat methyltransferase